ncbi:MAG: hypothetical protein NVS1B4_07430 [Gemmatimonadaceae bacterium]
MGRDFFGALRRVWGDEPKGARIFFDTYGQRWQVSEQTARRASDATDRTCLIFESSGAVRRVWNYPANWRGLTSAQLVTLSWGT